MLPVLFHRVAPAALYGGQTVQRLVQSLHDGLRSSDPADALSVSKNLLFREMRQRFGGTAAQALALKVVNTAGAVPVRAPQHNIDGTARRTCRRSLDMCTLACPGCVHSERAETFKIFDWPKGTLSQDRSTALLENYAPHAVAVYFYNYGEPLLNLRTPQLIAQAKRYLVTTLISTSLSVKRFDPEAYVASGLDIMVVSIDGATQEIYGRYRRNGDLELVLHNLRELVAAKKRLGRRLPVLSWNFLAFEHNIHQMPQAMRMARSIGVDPRPQCC